MQRQLPLACLVVFLSALTVSSLAQSGGKKAPASTRQISNFSLKDPRDNRSLAFKDLKDRKAIVVVFVGTECPVNNAFLPELIRLHKEFSPRGVQFLAINSNQQDTPDRIVAHARKLEVPFPVLKDPLNTVADLFGAQRTPEVFVLSPEGKILYNGRIDDQYGIGYQRPGKPTRRDLVEALQEILAGKPVSVASTPVAGCLIGRVVKPRAEGKYTFTRDIVPILQKHCQECHRPGQIGPMALIHYDDVTAWSAMIEEVVTEKRMPPWYADPKHGKFANDRSLPAKEKEILLAWLNGGMARGNDKDLPPPRRYPVGWTIGKPDLVLTMPRAFDIPAVAPKGGIPYQYYELDPGFKEDRWVTAAEARPDAAAVVHHMLVFIVPKGVTFHPNGPYDVLCGMAPGDMPTQLAGGLAKRVPAGARLVLQMHYTPNGKAFKDQSSIGMRFSKENPKHRVITFPIVNEKFFFKLIRIPPGDDHFKMEATYRFRRDAHILSFMPHMHLRGKDFTVEAHYPNGKTETLLSVPHYNFNWQSIYRLEKPLAMPAGTQIRCVAHFDNSAKNPHNPDPTVAVTWGDQTWEEMMVGWMDFYYDTPAK